MPQKRETGQGLLEYALIISLVAIVIILALTVFGEDIAELYDQIVNVWPT
jgi:Flp pilus assembly pilin Flp